MSERNTRRGAVLGVIPARLGSERLPRKPLQTLAGLPLIQWVWRRVLSLGVLDRVVVATDSEEVLEVCRGFGATVELTAATHPSGTHRVAEVAGKPDYREYPILVNVQGDEPFVTSEQVAGAVEAVRSGWDIGTVAAPVATPGAWRDPAVVKVVRNEAGGALYFTRAPVPHVRGREPTADELASDSFLRHIGVYAYSRAALSRWAALPAGPLGTLERLEQLDPLAAGLAIGVAVVDAAEGGVDTPEDATRVASRLEAMADPERSRT